MVNESFNKYLNSPGWKYTRNDKGGWDAQRDNGPHYQFLLRNATKTYSFHYHHNSEYDNVVIDQISTDEQGCINMIDGNLLVVVKFKNSLRHPEKQGGRGSWAWSALLGFGDTAKPSFLEHQSTIHMTQQDCEQHVILADAHEKEQAAINQKRNAKRQKEATVVGDHKKQKKNE